MKCCKSLCLAFALFIGESFLSPLASQEISFSGSLTSFAGAALPWTDNAGDFLVGNILFDASAKAYLDRCIVFVNGQLLFDALSGQSTNGAESFVSDDNRFALKLKEAYIDYDGGFWSLRAGRQIAAWGKADYVQIVDVLCPQDESVMIAANYKESRQGIDAVRISLNLDSFGADAYWIPFFAPSALPLAKGNALHSVYFPSAYDGTPFDNPSSYKDFDLPGKKLYNSEFALKISSYFSALDFSLYAFYGWDDFPFFSYSANAEGTKINVNGTYERLLMFGADIAVPVKQFVLRAEAAYFPNRHFQTNGEYQFKAQESGSAFDCAKKSHQIMALAGFDWDTGFDFIVSAQYLADVVLCDGDTLGALERKRFRHIATLTLDKTLFRELLEISLTGYFDLNDFSTSTELEVEYKITDALLLGVIADFYAKGFDGKDGEYGVYKDLSCLTLKAKVSF